MEKNIIVVSYTKIVVEFVSVVSFYFSLIYIYGKMVFLMAHRFLFSLVTHLALKKQHFPLATSNATTPAFAIKTVSCFVFMIFTCFTTKLRHLWLQNIANKQFENLQQFRERQTDRARKGDLLLFSLIFICDFSIKYKYIYQQKIGSGDRRNKRRYGAKRKFRGNQHTSSQGSSKKSREENSPANVSVSCSKLDNSLLFDKSYKFKKDNGGCSSIECYLIVNSVNILNLIDLIGS